MAEKKKKNASPKSIPTKNYMMALLLVVGALFIVLYAFELYKAAEQEKISKSYLMTSGVILHEIKTLSELNAVVLETPEDYFVYISYTGSKEVYDLEKHLKPIIKDYNLKEEFYFLNITDLRNACVNDSNCTEIEYLKEISDALNLPLTIEKVPVILYFRDNNLVIDGVVIREDEGIITSGDFQQLLDKFEITKTDR